MSNDPIRLQLLALGEAQLSENLALEQLVKRENELNMRRHSLLGQDEQVAQEDDVTPLQAANKPTLDMVLNADLSGDAAFYRQMKERQRIDNTLKGLSQRASPYASELHRQNFGMVKCGNTSLLTDAELSFQNLKTEHAKPEQQLDKLNRLANRKKVHGAVKDDLLKRLYRQGLRLMKEKQIDPKGWTKDISALLTHGVNGYIGRNWDVIAGFSTTGEGIVDSYDLGLTSIEDSTARNKLSQLTGFCLYCDAWEKSAALAISR